jgi:tungstate transport system substrate-binding protein
VTGVRELLRRGVVAAPLLVVVSQPVLQTRTLRLGTTTTVEQSGALAVVDSLWNDPPLTTIGPSGQILRAAAEGNLDVVITHAPALETRWLHGRARLRCPFVSSRFAIVGPASDPAEVASATDGPDAMRRIAQHGATFVSRGDSSGTHMKELALWGRAGVDPRHAAWYLESGASQAATLQIADEKEGYALADLPTFTRVQGITLKVLFVRDTFLENPYTLYVINLPTLHPKARAFAAFAMGSWRTHLLARRLPDGTPAFVTRTGGCTSDTTAADPRPGLEGTWEYQAPGGGLVVTLVFDSIAGADVFGRVTRWFAGDVGRPAGTFGRVAGHTDGQGVAFTIPFAQSGIPPIRARGALRGDTLTIVSDERGGPFAPGASFVRTPAP